MPDALRARRRRGAQTRPSPSRPATRRHGPPRSTTRRRTRPGASRYLGRGRDATPRRRSRASARSHIRRQRGAEGSRSRRAPKAAARSAGRRNAGPRARSSAMRLHRAQDSRVATGPQLRQRHAVRCPLDGAHRDDARQLSAAERTTRRRPCPGRWHLLALRRKQGIAKSIIRGGAYQKGGRRRSRQPLYCPRSPSAQGARRRRRRAEHARSARRGGIRSGCSRQQRHPSRLGRRYCTGDAAAACSQ